MVSFRTRKIMFLYSIKALSFYPGAIIPMRKCTLLEEVISAFVLASCTLRKTSKNINPPCPAHLFSWGSTGLPCQLDFRSMEVPDCFKTAMIGWRWNKKETPALLGTWGKTLGGFLEYGAPLPHRSIATVFSGYLYKSSTDRFKY